MTPKCWNNLGLHVSYPSGVEYSCFDMCMALTQSLFGWIYAVEVLRICNHWWWSCCARGFPSPEMWRQKGIPSSKMLKTLKSPFVVAKENYRELETSFHFLLQIFYCSFFELSFHTPALRLVLGIAAAQQSLLCFTQHLLALKVLKMLEDTNVQ